MKNKITDKLNTAKLYFLTHLYRFNDNNKGMGVIEIVLIILEKPNAKHRYVLCGN